MVELFSANVSSQKVHIVCRSQSLAKSRSLLVFTIPMRTNGVHVKVSRPNSSRYINCMKVKLANKYGSQIS